MHGCWPAGVEGESRAGAQQSRVSRRAWPCRVRRHTGTLARWHAGTCSRGMQAEAIQVLLHSLSAAVAAEVASGSDLLRERPYLCPFSLGRPLEIERKASCTDGDADLNPNLSPSPPCMSLTLSPLCLMEELTAFHVLSH